MLNCSRSYSGSAEPPRRFSRKPGVPSLPSSSQCRRKAETCLARKVQRGYAADPTVKLQAARELAARAIAEDLGGRDCLSSPRAARDLLKLKLAGLPHEVFVCLQLDAQHRVIAIEELFRGTLTQTSVYPREVVKAALRANAAAVIFAHNHPSGVAEPSHADEILTRSLKSGLALVDVQVLDHFIVARTRVMSFAERGLL